MRLIFFDETEDENVKFEMLNKMIYIYFLNKSNYVC